jgi:hypothetical protein
MRVNLLSLGECIIAAWRRTNLLDLALEDWSPFVSTAPRVGKELVARIFRREYMQNEDLY